ncbi:hypothetical protein HPP92_027346 [Vanilla planifolia]|uniref:WAT1-related protein n=1 Tax=Vanilla planifolia TaxID=51239 RepID=A0A835U5G4_VANPL|nr:hypothetical protein HPP92_027346 [Vanilla planifolia]
MVEKLKLLITVLTVHLCYATSHIVTRTALNMGVSKLVFLVYRNIIAFLFLAPFAYFLEKMDRPSFTFAVLIQLFLLALIGITINQGCYLLGLYYLTPMYVSAIQNSVPAITFVIAAALRIYNANSFEKVNINKKHGVAKVVGTLASIGGASIITLYKGTRLLQGHKNYLILGMQPYSSQILNWTLGCVFILGNCIAWSAWMVFQASVLRRYPARLSVTTWTFFFGVIQLITIAAFVEKDIEMWKVHSRGELLTILFVGIVSSGITFSLQIWCIDRGGPLFVSVFQPVQTVMVAIMATILLGEQFYSGGLIGSILIMFGLYSVLWGKDEEMKVAGLEAQEITDRLLDQENPETEISLAS